MILMLDNFTDTDIQALRSHLFRRQFHLFVHDGAVYVGVEIDNPFDLNFLASILKCRFLFTPFAFEHENIRYSALTILRDEDEEEDEEPHSEAVCDISVVKEDKEHED